MASPQISYASKHNDQFTHLVDSIFNDFFNFAVKTYSLDPVKVRTDWNNFVRGEQVSEVKVEEPKVEVKEEVKEKGKKKDKASKKSVSKENEDKERVERERVKKEEAERKKKE